MGLLNEDTLLKSSAYTSNIMNNTNSYGFMSTSNQYIPEYLINTSMEVIRTIRSSEESNHEQAINWTVLCLTSTLIILTWLANCILLGGALQTAGNGKNVPVAYFFIGSQAIGALLHVTLNLPPSIVNILFGTSQVNSYVHIFCLYSIYLDTLFCNLTFLQTFFSSLDAYLRLKNPIFYLSSARRRPALWLKIGSPWLMASLQAIGQLALSDRRQVRLHMTTLKPVTPNQYHPLLSSSLNSNEKLLDSGLNTACLLPDPNFLIIRTVIAYALPLITCLILVILQLHGLRRLRHHSAEMLSALLSVRSRSTNEYEQIMYQQNNPHYPRHEMASMNRRIPSNFHNSELIWKVRDTPMLNKLNSSTSSSHTVTHNPCRRLSFMTNSYHLDTAYTNETLVADSNPSMDRIQHLTNPPLSTIILSTGYLPVESVNELQLSKTTSVPVFECPTHGCIRVTQSTSPLAVTCIPESSGQQTKDQLSPTQNTSASSENHQCTDHDARATESIPISLTSVSSTVSDPPVNNTNDPLMVKSNSNCNEPVTSDTILLNIDGTQVKLLPFSYQQDPLSSSELSHYQYLPSMIQSNLLPQHHQHTTTTVHEMMQGIPTEKLYKSKSDYQIKSKGEVNSPNSCDQLIRSNSMKTSFIQPTPVGTLANDNSATNLSKTNLWLSAYQGEQLVVAINLVSCIIAVGTWSPYILASLAHGLCQPISIPKSMFNQIMHPLSSSSLPTSPVTINSHLISSPLGSLSNTPGGNLLSNPTISRCWIHLSVDRLADFRWWAYASSGLLLPCLLFFLDLGLREGCWRALQYKTKPSEKYDSPKALTHNPNSQYSKSINTTNNNQSSRDIRYHQLGSVRISNIPYDANSTSNNRSVKLQEFEMTSSISHTK
ncbi:unnamed protein product [Trichobilharzia szidati]|nr:unnamed protein product [Trichobilharzia szidati]